MDCELERVRQLSMAVRNALARHGASEENLMGCELALVEACNNAILYATAAGRQQPVEIQCLGDGAQLEIQIIDHTPGFDLPPTLDLPDPEAEQGRGLFIIRTLMDEVLYLRGPVQNRLIMRKKEFFTNTLSEGVLSRELLQTREKLALTEQVINTMARELYTQITSARAQQEQVDRRLLAHELEIARNIQHSLLPKKFPVLPGFALSGFCVSARQVGGDFYDVLPLSSDMVLLVVADVMGKGVPAALFAATLRTLLRTTVQWTRRPAKLLRRINRLMFDDLSGVDMFITAQLVLADTRVGRLVVASAGHCPLLLTEGKGEIEVIGAEGMPLGILPEVQFEEEVVPLRPSSFALLYSDGLTEARNPAGELFGQQRLSRWMLENSQPPQSASQLAALFQAELKQFQGTVAPADDQTFLLIAPEPVEKIKRQPDIPLFSLSTAPISVLGLKSGS